MSPSSNTAAPTIVDLGGYFLGSTVRRRLQKTANGPRVVESPTNTLQGKVVSMAPRVKRNKRGSNYYTVRIAVGEQGFCMAVGYDKMLHEMQALTPGDIVAMDGTWRKDGSKPDPRTGQPVNWFNTRTMTLLQNAPFDEPPAPGPDEYDETEHF